MQYVFIYENLQEVNPFILLQIKNNTMPRRMDELKSIIESIDRQSAAEAVRRFVREQEQKNLDLWNKDPRGNISLNLKLNKILFNRLGALPT